VYQFTEFTKELLHPSWGLLLDASGDFHPIDLLIPCEANPKYATAALRHINQLITLSLLIVLVTVMLSCW